MDIISYEKKDRERRDRIDFWKGKHVECVKGLIAIIIMENLPCNLWQSVVCHTTSNPCYSSYLVKKIRRKCSFCFDTEVCKKIFCLLLFLLGLLHSFLHLTFWRTVGFSLPQLYRRKVSVVLKVACFPFWCFVGLKMSFFAHEDMSKLINTEDVEGKTEHFMIYFMSVCV